MGERLPYKEEVEGSIPSAPTQSPIVRTKGKRIVGRIHSFDSTRIGRILRRSALRFEVSPRVRALARPEAAARRSLRVARVGGSSSASRELLTTILEQCARSLGHKRSLALREFALGVESLERFVRADPLYRVHEPVFGVLALESEPVDPRL